VLTDRQRVDLVNVLLEPSVTLEQKRAILMLRLQGAGLSETSTEADVVALLREFIASVSPKSTRRKVVTVLVALLGIDVDLPVQ
jgi:hypothetical protein